MTAPSIRLDHPLRQRRPRFAHLLMLIFPTAVLAMEGTWGLGYAELLPLGFAGYLLFGLGALPAGWLADRWSSAWMMALFYLGSGAACILTGLAVGPWSLALGLTLIGLFASIYHPVAIAWLVGRERPAGPHPRHQRRLRRDRHRRRRADRGRACRSDRLARGLPGAGRWSACRSACRSRSACCAAARA